MADAYSVILTLPSWVAKDNLAPPIHRTEQEHENDNIDREIAELGRHEPHSTTWKRLIREMRNTPRKLVLGTGQLAEQY